MPLNQRILLNTWKRRQSIVIEVSTIPQRKGNRKHGLCFSLKINAELAWIAESSTVTACRARLANRLPLKSKDQSSLEIGGLRYSLRSTAGWFKGATKNCLFICSFGLVCDKFLLGVTPKSLLWGPHGSRQDISKQDSPRAVRNRLQMHIDCFQLL